MRSDFALLAALCMIVQETWAFRQPSPAGPQPMWAACRKLRRYRNCGLISAAVDVSPLKDARYVRMLSNLCCEAFYGVQKPWEKLNPFGQLQRGLVLQEIELDLQMRMDRYRRAAERPCGEILVAVDDGTLAGFVDVSLTLYDTASDEFFVSQGPGHGVPSDEYIRRRYIANLGRSGMLF